MPDVLIKSDVHTSEAELERFEELRGDFDSALQEKRPDREVESGPGGRLVRFFWDGYVEKLADLIQRDSDADPGLDSLDLGLGEMYSSLEVFSRFLLYGFTAFWFFMGFLSVLAAFLRPVFLFWSFLFFLMLPVVHVMNVVLLSTWTRERRMAERTLEELGKDEVEDVVVFVGSAHSVPLKNLLRMEGVDVEIEEVSGIARLLAEPVTGFRQVIWKLRRLFRWF
ncbi:MAG: hypothetical protein ABEJ36_03265 [Candidatus Nanosalina sp.]